jgi:3-hydroxybutyryl-CoA dehydrogenase
MHASAIRNVTVTGVGVMGAVISQVFAVHGYQVTLHDLSEARLDWAWDRIEHHRYGLRRAVEIGRMTRDEADATLERISATTDLAQACRDADLVVEAVPEDIALKIRVFRALDQLAPPNAILTSNTAGLPIASLAAATDRPERVLGWHWFQPASVMKLAELIVHDGTAPETRDTIVAVARSCGKEPVVVNDWPFAWGFVANRIMERVRHEAQRIVDEGIATRAQVDAIMMHGFRWPIGPFGDIPE